MARSLKTLGRLAYSAVDDVNNSRFSTRLISATRPRDRISRTPPDHWNWFPCCDRRTRCLTSEKRHRRARSMESSDLRLATSRRDSLLVRGIRRFPFGTSTPSSGRSSASCISPTASPNSRSLDSSSFDHSAELSLDVTTRNAELIFNLRWSEGMRALNSKWAPSHFLCRI